MVLWLAGCVELTIFASKQVNSRKPTLPGIGSNTLLPGKCPCVGFTKSGHSKVPSNTGVACKKQE